MTEDKSELLVNALITKMEVMDSNIEILKQENERLKSIINNPQRLLRKMGMVKLLLHLPKMYKMTLLEMT